MSVYSTMTVKQIKDSDAYDNIPVGYNKSKLNKLQLIDLIEELEFQPPVIKAKERVVSEDMSLEKRVEELERLMKLLLNYGPIGDLGIFGGLDQLIDDKIEKNNFALLSQ